MVGHTKQKEYITGFPYGHNKRVAETNASQRRANEKLIRARRAVIKHRLDKGRKTIVEIEQVIGVKT